MEPGCLLEFIEGGRVLTAVCLETKKGRIRALTETMRELQLGEDRIIGVEKKRLETDQTREALAKRLQEISSRRELLKEKVDVRGLWEVVHGEAEELSARDLAELAFGEKIGADEISAVIRAMLQDRVYFRFRPPVFRPNPPDTVEKILVQRAREEEKQRLLEEGSRWLRCVWEGRQGEPPVQFQELVEVLKEKAIYNQDAPRSSLADELLRRAGLSHPLAPFQLLVKLGVWSKDENLYLYKFGIRREFLPEIISEAQKIVQRVLDQQFDPLREELTGVKVFTVDSPHTKDIDDALSIERLPGGNWRVGVHITDVSSTIQMCSSLDEEAMKRATSIYLPEERIPMLPQVISEDACSLVEGRLRPTVSLLLEVDAEGEVLSHRFGLCWIRVSRRLSYEEVDERIQEGDEILTAIYRICLKWRKERIDAGGLLLPLPEVSVRVKEGGEIEVERRDREAPSQILVSEMMIKTNWLAAKLMHGAGVPCLYRAQPEPRERVLGGPPEGDLLTNYKQRKLLSRVSIQLEPAPHSGLGLFPYTTITSPIRRYLDLAIQRQLVAVLKSEPPPYTKEALQKIAAGCEEAMAQAAQMEQARHRYWLLRYLEGRKGLEARAMVLGRYGQKVHLLLPDYMLESSLPIAAAGWLREGQEVRVRIVRARPLEDDLKVELC